MKMVYELCVLCGPEGHDESRHLTVVLPNVDAPEISPGSERPTVPAPNSEAERSFDAEMLSLYRGRWGVPRSLKLPLEAA
jgi:hypothetical protein